MRYLVALILLLSGCTIELSHTDTHEYAYDIPECCEKVLNSTNDYVAYTYENGDRLFVSRLGDGYICVKRK